MWPAFKSTYTTPGHQLPPGKHVLQHPATIGVLLQNGKYCHQVAVQIHVSYSTVQKLYSSVKDSLPKHPGWHPRQLIANDQHSLLILPHSSRDFQASMTSSKQLWMPKKGKSQDCHRAEKAISFLSRAHWQRSFGAPPLDSGGLEQGGLVT